MYDKGRDGLVLCLNPPDLGMAPSPWPDGSGQVISVQNVAKNRSGARVDDEHATQTSSAAAASTGLAPPIHWQCIFFYESGSSTLARLNRCWSPFSRELFLSFSMHTDGFSSSLGRFAQDGHRTAPPTSPITEHRHRDHSGRTPGSPSTTSRPRASRLLFLFPRPACRHPQPVLSIRTLSVFSSCCANVFSVSVALPTRLPPPQPTSTRPTTPTTSRPVTAGVTQRCNFHHVEGQGQRRPAWG